MKFSMKSLAAVGVLATLASTPALAVDGAQTGNGSLFITVFDTNLGASLVQDLGLHYSDFSVGQGINPALQAYDFNVDLSHFTSVGSNFGDLRWTVFAADSLGNHTGTGMVGTAAAGLSITGMNSNVVAMMGNSIQVTESWKLNCGTDALVCTGANFSSSYYGGGSWGERFGSQMPVDGSGSLGDSLGFYLLTRSGIGAAMPLQSQEFAATWTLGQDGSLAFAPAPVPLPAAVWMLLSGLTGLGVVGRRKVATA